MTSSSEALRWEWDGWVHWSKSYSGGKIYKTHNELDVVRVVTEREKLKTLIRFLSQLLEKQVVPSSSRDWITACRFFQIMDFSLYFTVLVNKPSFACVLFVGVPSVNSSILIDLQFRSEKKIQNKLLVTLSFVGAVKWKRINGNIQAMCGRVEAVTYLKNRYWCLYFLSCS